MKVNVSELIQAQIQESKAIIQKIEALKNRSEAQLNWRDSPEKWSTLECLEHLNLYRNFYLPAVKSTLVRAKNDPVSSFTSGWLGNYFAESMLPKPKLNRMKTFKSKNPIHKKLDKSVIDTFLIQQQEWIDLLAIAQHKNLGKNRIKTSISPVIRLKLGDTIRFYFNHILRHIDQLERISGEN